MELWPGGPLVLPHELWLDDHRVVIPDIPSTTILGWLAAGLWWELIPGNLDVEDFKPFMMRFWTDGDEYDYEHLYDVATLILGRLSGMSALDGSTDGYWPARRLASTALRDWPNFAAWCAAHGTPPVNRPLYEIMGSIYGWLRDRGGPTEIDKLDQQIYGPPPHVITTDAIAVPRHIRDQEAAFALAALNETLPGLDAEPEWRNSPLP